MKYCTYIYIYIYIYILFIYRNGWVKEVSKKIKDGKNKE
jgi:hypothetical protein